MSSDRTHISVSVGRSSVQVSVDTPGESRSSRHDTDPSDHQSWEVISEAPGEELELVVARGPAPLHLLRRSRLRESQGWTPERRIERAFQFGQRDTQAALDSVPQDSADRFPIRSAVYVVLYDPTGEWPKYTRSLQRFYELVKTPCRGQVPGRSSPWRSGVVSRGFPSIVEAEAYLAGGQCRLPREES